MEAVVKAIGEAGVEAVVKAIGEAGIEAVAKAIDEAAVKVVVNAIGEAGIEAVVEAGVETSFNLLKTIFSGIKALQPSTNLSNSSRMDPDVGIVGALNFPAKV